MRNIKLILEYEGTEYHGWQVQPGQLTVQQVLEERLARILQENVSLIGAGRTDAGVHAYQQVANFRCASRLPLQSLQKGVNSLLPGDIAVTGSAEVSPEFNARYWARSKVYAYRILNRSAPSAFWRRWSWLQYRPLSLEAMEKALPCLLGTHDFSAFRASGCTARTVVRTVLRADLTRRGDMVEIRLEANAFLRYMVRNVVGTLVEIGLGRRAPEEMAQILAGRDRRRAGATAPARGLTLERVFLKEEERISGEGKAT